MHGPSASREFEAWRGVALSRKDARLKAKQLHRESRVTQNRTDNLGVASAHTHQRYVRRFYSRCEAQIQQRLLGIDDECMGHSQRFSRCAEPSGESRNDISQKERIIESAVCSILCRFASLSKTSQFYTPSAENRRGFRPQRHRVHTRPSFKAPKGNAASKGFARHEWEIELPPIVGSQQNAWIWRT